LADVAADVWLAPRRLSGGFSQHHSRTFDPANCPKL
jgi:hypothetical protein